MQYMTPPTVYILHGIGGSPDENWFPWLKRELETQGCTVIVPQFPHPHEPKLDEWLEHFSQFKLTKDAILVGHSLGGIFALRILEKVKSPIRATFLVAPVTGPLDGKDYAPLMTTFTEAPLDHAAIKQQGGSIHLLHADNDPYISLEHAENLATKLGINVDLIPGGGHLGTLAGFAEFPKLRSGILKILAED